MKLILKYFKKAITEFPRLFLSSFFLIAALTAVDTFVPWGLRQFLEQLNNQPDYHFIIEKLALFALYLFVRIFLNIAWYISLDKFGGKCIESLSLSLQEAMKQAAYSDIEKTDPNIIRNVLFTDVLNIFRAIGHNIPSIIGALAILFASVGIGFACEKKMTLFIFFAVLLGLFLSWSSRKILSKYSGKTNAKLKIHDSWCTQFVNMLPLIHTHNILSYYQENTKENLHSFISTSIQEDKRVLFWSGIVSSYHSLFSIVLSVLLALPVAGNSISNLVFFTMIANLVMEQAQQVEQLFQQLVRYTVSFQHVDNLLNLPQKGGCLESNHIHSICFKDIGFTYPNGVCGLKHVNCQINLGDTVHLEGENGSGKSTFIKLLTGLYPQTTGEILLDGLPIESFSQESLNRQVLYINQDELCLNESFHDYLELISEKHISDENFENMLTLVNLPDDNRKISGNGSSLSVGQRKKLFLLKLLLRKEDASIIILDELTAGMDSVCSNFVYQLIDDLASQNNKIILIVDHTLPETVAIRKSFRFEAGELEVSIPSAVIS